ncbi:MAG: glycoside hydrolase family 15 protein [Vicinamibacterales bacterium]
MGCWGAVAPHVPISPAFSWSGDSLLDRNGGVDVRLIEDYALIGDTQTAALVGLNGSIDWLCLPRFDSSACFAALLGSADHGRWHLTPTAPIRSTRRRYRGATLVLETEFTTDEGTVCLIDCMPPRQQEPDVVRLVRGVSGTVELEMELVIRFDYGSIVPWVRTIQGRLTAIGGPDALSLDTPITCSGVGLTTRATFSVREGEVVPFVLVWHPSHLPAPAPVDAVKAVDETETWWHSWSSGFTYDGPWRDAVLRSAITLKALTYSPTGGIVAAPTTSLPEHLGGVRNWDYRYCWLRDATFTLYALIVCGFLEEAAAWRNWLLRAVAGDPARLQIMYGPAGERRLPEMELPWLPGYAGSHPVRIGNAAVRQRQLDVYGEVFDALHVARRSGLAPDESAWHLETALLGFLEQVWTEPDEGIWEVRGPRRHFTHSKLMAWVAFDRAIKAVERGNLDGPAGHWREIRAAIHSEICARGFDARRQTFTQYYGSDELDASLLMVPMVGFLSPDDRRVVGTVAAVEKHLMRDGFVMRYTTSAQGQVDGLPKGEGAFLPCSFWLADNYTLMGRLDDARQLFERLLGLTNDVGLIAEEYDPDERRLLGNFPQAFSHVSLINTARNLAQHHGPAEHRQGK